MLLGAGMSKLGSRSSACWRDLSCTSTHYFTQPMPTPAAWVFHKLPASVHKVEVALTFFEQAALDYTVDASNYVSDRTSQASSRLSNQ
eukprot:6205563-Pleurochrysis_carterae.AAC.1